MTPKSSPGRAESDIDLLVYERYFAPACKTGVCVDVGAARPDYLSVSALFRELCWRVIAIDANPAYLPYYDEIGAELLVYACGEADVDGVPFTVVDSHGESYCGDRLTFESFSSLEIKPGMVGLKSNLDTRRIAVNQRRLDTILSEHAADVSTVDLLTVDVEGWELEAMRGFDFARYDPKVVVVENLLGEESYSDFMTQRNFVLWRHIVHTSIWERRE